MINSIRPDGQTDKNVRGETSVLISRTLRDTQEATAQTNTMLHEIRMQVGEHAFTGVLKNEIEVSGVIRAEDRTYTILLMDKESGREIGRAVDVQRVVGHANVFNIQENIEALNRQ